MEILIELTTNPSFVSFDEPPWISVDNFSHFNDSLSSTIPLYVTLGPQRDPLYIVVPITIIYLAILFTGTIGNISTCIVIARNKSMHTATNYYLFSLAVSDLLLLIFGLPVEVYLVWSKYTYVFGEIFCMLRGMAAECSTNASVLTITAFTVERYVAICHPFLSHTLSKLSRAIKLILVIWLVALCFAIPMALQFGVVSHELNPNFSMCTLKVTLYEHSFEIATLLFFIVPMILITVLYVMIGLKLRQSNMMKRDHGKSRSVRDSSSSTNSVSVRIKERRNCRHHTGRSSRRVLKMLVAVVVAFFICWAPFHVQRLIYIYGTADDHVSSKSRWMEFLYILATYVSGVLYYVSATINPILYNIMSNKFREAFMETLGRTFGRGGFSVPQEQRSYSSLSRSQQRGPGGFFGSRPAGTIGSALAQDSADYSGNSIRDEAHLQRSPSVGTQYGVAVNLEITRDPVHRCNSNGSVRKISVNTDPQIYGEDGLNLLNSSNRLPMIHEQTQDRLSPSDHPERTRRWHDGSYRVSRNNKINASPVNCYTDNYQNCHHNQLGLGPIDNSAVRHKKWWRIFKWLPDAKVFKFGIGRNRYPTSGSPMVNIESNREEYSMTSCNLRNAGNQRPV